MKTIVVVTLSVAVVYSQEILTLQKCIELAIENNQSLKIMEKKLEEANAKIKEAKAYYLPTASLDLSYTRISEAPSLEMAFPVIHPVPVEFRDIYGKDFYGFVTEGFESFKYKMGEEDNYLAKISLTQPIFTWGKIKQGNIQAQLNYKLVKEEERKVKNELVFNVKRSFYSVLLAKKFLEIAEISLKVMERHYEVVEGFYKEGKVPLVDVSRAKVVLVNTQTNKIKANNNFILAKKALLNLINIEDKDYQIEGELKFEALEPDFIKYFNEALKERPEIKQIDIQREIVEVFLKLTKAENKPTLSVVSSYQYQKPFYFRDEWDSLWNVILALRFPFFSPAVGGKIKQIEANLKQLDILKEQIKNNIKLEIEKICLDLKESAEKIKTQEENVKLAKENLDIIQKRYEIGLVSDLDLRDTQLALTQAETEYSQALFDYNVALASLEKATGGGVKK